MGRERVRRGEERRVIRLHRDDALHREAAVHPALQVDRDRLVAGALDVRLRNAEIIRTVDALDERPDRIRHEARDRSLRVVRRAAVVERIDGALGPDRDAPEPPARCGRNARRGVAAAERQQRFAALRRERTQVDEPGEQLRLFDRCPRDHETTHAVPDGDHRRRRARRVARGAGEAARRGAPPRRAIGAERGQVGRDDAMTRRAQQRHDAIPAPRTVPGAVDQQEGGQTVSSRVNRGGGARVRATRSPPPRRTRRRPRARSTGSPASRP